MFVHLRVHSDYSVVDGTARIDPLIQAAAANGQPALALTDLNNMFGAIKFYSAARQAGVKPILGVEVMLTGLAGQAERNAPGQAQQPLPRVLLLAQNTTGYHGLCLLLSRCGRPTRAATSQPLTGPICAPTTRGWCCFVARRPGPLARLAGR